MADLVLPASSAPGAIPGEGTGRLVNAQAFKDGTEVRWGAVPGLKSLASPGVGTPRGGLLVGNLLYLVREDALFSMTVANSLRRIGTLQGDRPVTMARNNRASTATSAGPDVVAVTEVGPFVVTPSGIADYPGTVIGSPNDVSFLDGYFLFTYPDGTIRATGTNTTPTNTTDMSDQSFTVAESNPDGLMRGTVSAGQFYAWGQASIEIYADQGLTPFPLSRQQVIPIGLYGPWCVAGFETGWNGSQIFVAADGTVRRLDGYTPTRISTRAVERSIASVTGPNVLRASVYTYGGNAIWSLSAPGWTWEYNVTTDAWHERVSTGLTRWRGETSVFAFGKWVVGDFPTGDVLAISEAFRTENGQPVVARIESAPLRQIPDRLRLGRLTLDITTGQGDPGGEVPDETDPCCRISWSVDGGARWAQPLIRQIGGPGEYGVRVSVGDIGRATREGVRVAVEVSDPVAFSLRGVSLPDVMLRKGG